MSENSLEHRRIAVPETRQLDVLAGLLERRGAAVVRCPLVSIHDTLDTASVHQWLDDFIADPFDDLILLTGEGLRRLLGFAERANRKTEFLAALAKTRTLVRGPKPAKVLRELQLKPQLQAMTPTTDGVIASLKSETLEGRRIGVQLYGEDPNLALQSFLQAAGAEVFPVAPYRYADELEDEQVGLLIDELLQRRIDAICFTSSPQIRRLLSVARARAQEPELKQVLNDITVAAVGPVVADALDKAGLQADIMPQTSFFMKPLVQALVDHWR